MTAAREQSLSSWASKRPTVSEWIVIAILAMALIGNFVVRPVVEDLTNRVLQGVGGVLAGIAQAAGAAVQAAHTEACIAVEHDPLVIALVGEPVICQPATKSEFLAGTNGDDFQFKFGVAGPQGIAQAHVVAVVTETGTRLESIVVTGGGQSIQLPVTH